MASSERKVESEWMVFCSYQVPDFDQWLMEYNKIAKTGYLKELGITKSVVCKGENNIEGGNMTIYLTHYFPKSSLDSMKKVLDFECHVRKCSIKKGPSVGGDDLTGKGIVIPPCALFFGEVKHEHTQDGEPVHV